MAAEQITIYALVDPRNDAVRYIGRSVNPAARLQTHLLPGSGSGAHQEWLRELRSVRLKPILRELSVVDATDADRMERLTIAHYRALGCTLTNDLSQWPRPVQDDRVLAIGGMVSGTVYNGIVAIALANGQSIGGVVAMLLAEALAARAAGVPAAPAPEQEERPWR